MTRALVLRHHQEDHCGLIGESFEARGYEIDLRMMNAEHPSPSLDGYDVMVILGSKSAVYDQEVEAAWFGRELELIAEAQRRAIPIHRESRGRPVPSRDRSSAAPRLVRRR